MSAASTATTTDEKAAKRAATKLESDPRKRTDLAALISASSTSLMSIAPTLSTDAPGAAPQAPLRGISGSSHVVLDGGVSGGGVGRHASRSPSSSPLITEEPADVASVAAPLAKPTERLSGAGSAEGPFVLSFANRSRITSDVVRGAVQSKAFKDLAFVLGYTNAISVRNDAAQGPYVAPAALRAVETMWKEQHGIGASFPAAVSVLHVASSMRVVECTGNVVLLVCGCVVRCP